MIQRLAYLSYRSHRAIQISCSNVEMTVEEQFATADLAAGLWQKPPERDALKSYLAKLPPQLLSTLLVDMMDADARAALSKP